MSAVTLMQAGHFLLDDDDDGQEGNDDAARHAATSCIGGMVVLPHAECVRWPRPRRICLFQSESGPYHYLKARAAHNQGKTGR